MIKDENIIPASIFLASVFMSVALIVTAGGDGSDRMPGYAGGAFFPTQEPENVRPVTERDNIFGDINAPIQIIEFSNFECVFCKPFHSVMHQIAEEYEGKVAWVFRHFPFDSNHPKARIEAEASECVADLGGNEAFWVFIERIFLETPSNNMLDLTLLPEFAEMAGVNKNEFDECLRSGRFAKRVQEDVFDAVNSGIIGSPSAIMVVEDIFYVPIVGNQSYENMKRFVERALELI